MSWPRVQLRRMFRSVVNGAWGEEATPGEPAWPCIRAADFDYPRLRANLASAPLRHYDTTTAQRLELRRGDLVLEKSGGGVNTPVGRAVLYDSDEPALPTNFAARIRLAETMEPRFATYLLAHLYATGETEKCINQTTGIQNLDAGAWLGCLAPLPPAEEQRRIADFLDDQVARIDAAIQVGNSQLEELGALPGQSFLTEVQEGRDAGGWPTVRLGHLLRQFTNGYVGPTRDLLVEEGVPYIQSLHIKNGEIDFARRPYFVPQDWHDERPRIHLRQGDVLIVQTGDIGSVAVVPEDFMEASCHALIIARPRRDLVQSEYLGEFLRSPLGQSELLSRATGALHPHLESGIKDAAIVLPPLAEQDRITRIMRAVREGARRTTDAGIQRRSLLEERKRALITAAVTGEMDVTAAKPISVGRWVPGVGADVPPPAPTNAPSLGGI